MLYEGPSWYSAKIVDQISVTRNRIDIRFERSAKIDPLTYLYTKASPARIQLYRAACFYLAVTGTLPDVKKVVLRSAEGDTELDKDRLTQHWANCQIDLTLVPEDAVRCFNRDGKTCYVAITYFLKAQLDSFPHDCFRAAWSGVNAIYAHLGLADDSKEHEKLDALRKLIVSQPMTDASDYVKTLPDSFWHDINWGLLLKASVWKGRNNVVDKLQRNEYRDALIYQKLYDCLCRERRKEFPSEIAHLEKVHGSRMQNKKRDPKAEICFLVTEYCYMLRNRSFHAVRPYPVFGLFDESGNSTEGILTKLLLYVIRDLIAEIV